MSSISYVCLYLSYQAALQPYTDEEKGRILSAMLQYASTGEAPELLGNERFIWPTLRMQIDRDMASYENKCQINRANGCKGGRPRKNQTVNEKTERFLEKPKKAKENEKKNNNIPANGAIANSPGECNHYTGWKEDRE